MTPSGQADDLQRVAALRRYQVLDSLPEAAFDRITLIVKHLLKAPIVLINLVDVKRTWLKSSQGLNIHEMDRESGYCNQCVQRADVFAVPDLLADGRFDNDPRVKLVGARCYLGAPLLTPDGFAIGALAVYDTQVRHFTAGEVELLVGLAAVVIDELELRLLTLQAKQAQSRSDYQAHHDPLTGLPNRLRLLDRMEVAFRQSARSGHPVAVMVLDLDRFKLINDSLGHLVGDELLKQVGQRLCEALRADDSVARFGGDEFVLLVPHLNTSLDAVQVAQKVLLSLERPFQVGDHRLEVTGSLGISLYPNDGQDPQQLLRAADTAMYQAKTAGKAQVCFYTEDMTVAAQHKLHLHGNLTRALQCNELRVHYQPQVNLQTDVVVGLEALVRWPQADGSWLPPDQFIPLAEESRLIIELGTWVLWEACKQLAQWQSQGGPPWSLSVNVSVRQWEDPNFLSIIREVLEGTQVPAGCLVLEITESVMGSRPTEALGLVEQLVALGVRVALDDFGTGFSSLSQLQHLKVDQVKIDRSFVRDLPECAKSQAVTETIIMLGHRLGVSLIGEGIETEAQRDTLKGMSCDVGQGFLFARPMSPQDIEASYLSP
ncbi:EAL domain-containing protein [Deinococcus sp. QL22]|uniref:EAL domain-containing protein n=1 Tax=Deinococcus sp. QL22 TaxID=2939437 RepID=UPI002017063A|nr:EAL domain-containing protein [Deinococcus sp. QL22]UQN10185.1 EAL domain-containing protein [Deinococcus sp. QL22]